MKSKVLSGFIAITCTVFLTVAQPSLAQGTFEWSEFAVIELIEMTPAGVAYVKLDPTVVTNRHNCPLFGGWFIAIDINVDPRRLGFKEMITTWYVAAATGKRVRIGGPGCYQDTYPEATYIILEN